MRDLYRFYYPMTNDEYEAIWKEGTLIFDTNIFLNLYGYHLTARKEFFSVLDSLKNRLWMPYQVGLEFHKNKHDIIDKERRRIKKVKDDLEKIIKEAKERGDLFKEIEPHFENLSKTITDYEKKHLLNTEKDEVLEMVSKLFNEKIGREYNNEELYLLYSKGEERYKYRIPPGYADLEKGGLNQFGDFLIWMQILDYAEAQNKHVIFITEDQKEDWWQTHGKDKVGPRPELRAEFWGRSKKLFHMYTAEGFVKKAKKHLKLDLEIKTIIKEIQDNAISSSLVSGPTGFMGQTVSFYPTGATGPTGPTGPTGLFGPVSESLSYHGSGMYSVSFIEYTCSKCGIISKFPIASSIYSKLKCPACGNPLE